jgi:hypothetical protein
MYLLLAFVKRLVCCPRWYSRPFVLLTENNGFLLQPLARSKPLDIDILQQLYRTEQANDDTD